MTQQLSVQPHPEGVEFALSSDSEQPSMVVQQEQSERLARLLFQIVFRTEDPAPKTLLHPPVALSSPVPSFAWGAVDDGTIALSVHLNGLRPMLFKMTDEQAADIRDGLSELVAMPRDLRVPRGLA